MKQGQSSPPRSLHNDLIHVCAVVGLPTEARAFLQDMQMMGEEPDTQTFDSLLHAERFSDTRVLYEVVDMMRKTNTGTDDRIFHHIIKRNAFQGQVEMCLQLLSIMETMKIEPSASTVHHVIKVMVNNELPRLAWEVALAFEDAGSRRLQTESWLNCLEACADSLFLEGTLSCWQKLTKDRGVVLHEGLYLKVLNTASRHAQPTFAFEVLDSMEALGIALDEHHFSPLLEACCKDGQLVEAFTALELIASKGLLESSSEISRPLLDFVAAGSNSVDDAWDIFEQLHRDGHGVSVTSFNLLIEASVRINDLPRALGIFQAADTLDITPNIETYHALLSGVVRAGHHELGRELVQEMQAAAMAFTSKTYRLLISLSLHRDNYEEVFFLLEEMKRKGFRPGVGVYEEIIGKCVVKNDARWRLAVSEAKQQGYKLSDSLQALINAGGKEFEQALSEKT
ncbi:hypothetical protein SISNIDRAFT_410423 [Sistotremastrum niveocremeum HHB9708]|uniref:Pentatricopeptide repeat-containing protein-mitochondrial domain-containing protein n=1 Tax=Sistotremastrum niveocremeum HHB9708 TaxID=1314777 RepID=A0A164V7W8_9AGAM|nr:hypothetical protein SISNIDRAFT_410423 [Sistotremastrum niveocremeum HHB9708]